MSLIDERGRLFGKINLVDAAVGILVLLLIPLAYGAYLLFRTPAPKLIAIEPAAFNEGPNLRVHIRGENLRPFMRVSFGTQQGTTFLFAHPGSAEVDLPDLDPGKYDVVLYDYAQERDRLSAALTIRPRAPIPTVDVQVAGAFTGLTEAQAHQLSVGYKFPANGPVAAEIVALGKPREDAMRIRAGAAIVAVPMEGYVQVPATLRVGCFVEPNADGSLKCSVAGPRYSVPVAPDSHLTLAGLGGFVNFWVGEVLTTKPLVSEVRVRFVVGPEVLPHIKVGDVDRGSRAYPESQLATIVMLSGRTPVSPDASRGRGIAAAIVSDRLTALDAVLRVPVQETSTGWQYKGQPVKLGAPFAFETPLYTIGGGIVHIVPPRVAAGPRAADGPP